MAVPERAGEGPLGPAPAQHLVLLGRQLLAPLRVGLGDLGSHAERVELGRMEISPADVERLVADLVAIDSVNPALVPGGAGEAEVMSFAAAWMAAAGLDVEVVEAAPGRPSVVGTARGRGGGRSLMLNGHLDTVGVEGMSEPHAARVRDGRVYGRGGYDMKGGVAACMLAAAAAARADLAGDVVVAAVADEEHSSIGIQAVLEHVRADACVVTEPTSLDVVVAHKGFAWWEVSATGRAAHGSQPHLGVDAIAALGPVLVALGRARAVAVRSPPRAARPRLGARLADRGRAGALQLPGAMRPLDRAPHAARRGRGAAGRRAGAAGRGGRRPCRAERPHDAGALAVRGRSGGADRRAAARAGGRAARPSSRRCAATARGWTRRSSARRASRPSCSAPTGPARTRSRSGSTWPACASAPRCCSRPPSRTAGHRADPDAARREPARTGSVCDVRPSVRGVTPRHLVADVACAAQDRDMRPTSKRRGVVA